MNTKQYIAKWNKLAQSYDVIVDKFLNDNRERYAKENSKQLFTGEDSKGNILAPYASSTVKHKKRTGQISSKTILNDVPGSTKGAFHNNLFGEYENKTMKFSSDVSYTRYLVDQYGVDIFGLQIDNRKRVSVQYVKPEFKQEVKQIINN